ncbi:sulfur carrier protein ThiS [Clostridium sp. AF19-22AC]|jgi:sulfur carrier protein|uniref:sulfur carrier protein ThiS n=1 Tax=Clostridia TaxID=186801 RepID=UPI000E47C3AB|nr:MULTISPECIES: sulfur carrier protein ThiS [Clostridia]RHR25103.1 sulfur carrier protein ThiS [Clostridium sp. AF19-22AC]
MLKVNGKDRMFTAGKTVMDLLREMKYPAERVAVERNGDIVPKRCFSEVCLEDGDTIEVVSFVGGG